MSEMNWLGEVWTDVLGAKGFYSISNFGRLRSEPRTTDRKVKGGLIKSVPNRDGYIVAKLSLGSRAKHRSTFRHVLVAEAFIPNPLNLPEVEHKNRKRADNRASNLEWISKPDNDAKGERVHGSKLTAGQVEHIRGLLASGWKQQRLADQFGIDQSAVSNIKCRRNWKHI
jgi:hypothetical protein